MLKFIKYLSLICLLLISFNLIYAKDLEVIVDNREVEFPNSINLKVKVTSGKGELKIPNITDFVVISKGSKNIFDNKVVYEYNLIPKDIGFFYIPSFSYGEETSNSISIKVYGKKEKTLNVVSRDNDTSVTAEIDTKVVYVNQLVLYKIKLRTRQDLAGNPTYILPKFQDFWKGKFDLKSGYTLINGENYFTVEMITALYPMRTGFITIDPADFSLRYLGSKNAKAFQTNKINVKVLPLPETGKPDSFSGAVGRYTISAKVSRNIVKVREPFILYIDIKGNGNINSVFEPEFDLPGDMNKYSTSTELETTTLISHKRFKVTIIPLIEGKTFIPKIDFSYFDTDKNDYTTISTGKLDIEVVGGNKKILYEDRNLNSEKTKDLSQTKEIKFKENINLKNYKRQSIKIKTIVMFFIIMFVFILISFIYRMKLFYYYKDKERVKKDEAKKLFVKYFEQAKSSRNDKVKFIYYIDLAVKMLLRTKINYKYDTMSTIEIKELLYSLNIKDVLMHEIIKFITKIEQYKFKDIDVNLVNVTKLEYELLDLKKKLDEKS